MKFKFIGVIAVLCVFICCASPGAKQAKIYEERLQGMIGTKTADLENNFKEWNFGLMQTWQEENPSVEKVKEYNVSEVSFSDAEIQQIFSGEGKYHVQYYQKKEATSDASVGTISEDGMGFLADTTMASDRYTVVRVVYKDGVLTHFRVWGNVHQTSVSGFQRRR